MRGSPGPVGPEQGGGGPDPGKEASLLFHSGVALLPVLAVSFVVGLSLSIPDAVFIAFLLGTLPLLSMAQLPLLHQGTVDRLPAYAGSVVMLVLLTSVGLILGHLGPGLEALGLVPRFGGGAWRTTGWLVLAVLALAGVFWVLERATGWTESPLLMELIPRTAREKRLFAILSLAAGFGEEVVYRGYLLAVLGPIFSGPWTAALASTLAFAILHAYQGPVGIVRSGLLGFLFAGAFVLTGSIWPLVLVHTGIDLVSGLWLGPRMLRRD